MEHKLELSPKKILDEKFTKHVKGYDPDEVDAFLDKVILDYQSFLSYQKENEQYIASLRAELQKASGSSAGARDNEKRLSERIRSLEAENASLHNKLDNIRPGDSPTAENIGLINQVNRLSQFLYQLGYDPTTLAKRK